MVSERNYSRTQTCDYCGARSFSGDHCRNCGASIREPAREERNRSLQFPVSHPVSYQTVIQQTFVNPQSFVLHPVPKRSKVRIVAGLLTLLAIGLLIYFSPAILAYCWRTHPGYTVLGGFLGLAALSAHGGRR